MLALGKGISQRQHESRIAKVIAPLVVFRLARGDYPLD
jgi:hypothetical protein